MSELQNVRHDLITQQDALDDLVANLEPERWHVATASVGWDVADQIGHLTYFDQAAALAILDPEGFQNSVHALIDGATRQGVDDYTLGEFRQRPPREQLTAWRDHRRSLAEASAILDDGVRVAWYGPSMGATSFLTARLMEVWAHGTDVADALGLRLVATDRLRHVAQLGVITRKWSYTVRGEEMPPGNIRVELAGPSGTHWTWGDEATLESVRGDVEDFCLVVTQRRHLDDTNLVTTPLARDWLLRAQAFAGGPTLGPLPQERDGTR